MIVTCDKCGCEFTVMLKEEQKKIDGIEVTRTFLECPECGQQYNSFYDSQSTLVLKKQIKKRTEELKTIKNESQYKRKLKDISKKQKRLERETKILENKFIKQKFEEESREQTKTK